MNNGDKLPLDNAAVEAARAVLKDYLLPDCLKPEFDGMSLWEITTKALNAYEDAKTQVILKAEVYKSSFLRRCACDDPSCPQMGYQGEVPGHIIDCPCAHCHEMLGKI